MTQEQKGYPIDLVTWWPASSFSWYDWCGGYDRYSCSYDWCLQALLIRWLLVVLDYMEYGTLEKLRNLYNLLFLLLDFTLLVRIFSCFVWNNNHNCNCIDVTKWNKLHQSYRLNNMFNIRILCFMQRIIDMWITFLKILFTVGLWAASRIIYCTLSSSSLGLCRKHCKIISKLKQFMSEKQIYPLFFYFNLTAQFFWNQLHNILHLCALTLLVFLLVGRYWRASGLEDFLF